MNNLNKFFIPIIIFITLIFVTIYCGIFFSIITYEEDIVTTETTSVNESTLVVEKAFEVFDLGSLEKEVIVANLDGDEMYIFLKIHDVNKWETISLSIRGYSPADITVYRVIPKDLSVNSSEGETILSFPIMDWVEINVARTYHLFLEL